MGEVVEYDVDAGDPRNDQIEAAAREDLDWHIESARATLQEEGSRVEVTAVIASALIDAADAFPRERLASLLAVAMVREASTPPVQLADPASILGVLPSPGVTLCASCDGECCHG